jgi:mannose-6-phosphate isomerase class I
MRVVDFTPAGPETLTPETPARGVQVFDARAPEFSVTRYSLERMDDSAVIETADRPHILFCVDRDVRVVGSSKTLDLAAGESAFVGADATRIELHGTGSVYRASPGR